MNPHFADAIADGLDITWMPLRQPIQSRRDQRSGALVPETRSPFPKRFGLSEFDHL
jgi:hypothetical protein